MQIVFMGTPDFAVPSLQALINSEHQVRAVFSQPPRPAGRGKKLTKSPVQLLAEEHNIPVFHPEKLKGEVVDELAAIQPDIIAVAAYGLLLPESVLNIALCINVHPSRLPRWRGAAPIQHTILAGDETTDMCIMHMEKGLDTGAVYKRVSYPVGQNETAGELHDRMAEQGGIHLVDVLNNWPITPVPQSEDGIIYAHKITPDMRPIDFSKTAEEVHNHIRGLSPYPGATAMHGDDVLKLLRSEICDASFDAAKAGKIMAIDKQKITIATANGFINITQLQRPGKRAMNVAEFMNGYDLKVGDILR